MIKVISVIDTSKIKEKDYESFFKLYENYNKEKFEIVVLIPKSDKFKKELEKTKVKIIEIEEYNDFKWNFSLLFKLIKLFKSEKPDIVHSYENRISHFASNFLKDCKVIFTEKNTLESSPKKNFFIKICDDLLIDQVLQDTKVQSTEKKKKEKNQKDNNENETDKKFEEYINNIQNVYETLEREPKMKKINLLDIFIILIVLIACIIGYSFIKGTDNNVITPATNKVVYQIRATEALSEVYEIIEVGTPIYESRKNYCIGTIINKEYENSKRYGSDMESGNYITTEIEGKKDIILTIEVNAEKDAQNIMVQDYELKVGAEAYVKGKGYAAIGYIVSIER